MGWDAVKEARQRLSREQGTIIKDWGGRLPVALVYPNSYYIGMSNLGLHAIYRLLNSYDEVICERAFWEKGDRQLPALSLESQRPLSDFAVIAFSVSYELDYFNVVQVLKTSGIPLYAADRDERHPNTIREHRWCVSGQETWTSFRLPLLCLPQILSWVTCILSR